MRTPFDKTITIGELEKMTGLDVYMRSCWNCNSAHERLKQADYIIYCLWCDSLYYKGESLEIKQGGEPVYVRGGKNE